MFKFANQSLNKTQRLTQNRLFKETFSQNQKIIGKYIIIWLRSSTDTKLRLGVISSKKVHIRANKRNRARRWIREAYRRVRPYINQDVDIIIVSRPSILQAKWIEVYTELITLMKKNNLISHPNFEILSK